MTQQLSAGLAPGKNRGNRHQEKQRQSNRHRHSIEIRNPDRNSVVVDCFNNQREQRAKKDHECESRKQNIVREERAFARQRGIDSTW